MWGILLVVIAVVMAVMMVVSVVGSVEGREGVQGEGMVEAAAGRWSRWRESEEGTMLALLERVVLSLSRPLAASSVWL